MNSFFEENATLLLENSELANDFDSIMSYQKYSKHHILHEAGRVCNHFYIIISGIVRVFYYNEDKDITCHFAAEQETITAIDSFIQRKKSKYYIEALEDLEVMSVSHDDLEILFTKQTQMHQKTMILL